MSDNDTVMRSFVPLLGDLFGENLERLLERHFGGSQNRLATATKRAAGRRADVKSISQSAISKWCNRSGLVARLNEIDTTLRVLGLPEVTGHTLFAGVWLREDEKLHELVTLVSQVSPERLTAAVKVLKAMVNSPSDFEAAAVQLREYCETGDSLDTDLAALVKTLQRLPEGPQRTEATLVLQSLLRRFPPT